MIDRRLVLGGAAAMLAIRAQAAPAGQDDRLTLADGRVVPLRIWSPVGKPRALIAFSHGANSRPDKYDRLFERLAAAGYQVVAPLHADSPDHPGGGKIAREDGIPMRLADMRAVLAATTLPRIAAGHSYGALIAQMLGGAGSTPPEAVKAVLAWSPPGPFPPAITAETWAGLARPQLVVTGTADTLPMMAPTWDVHRVSFDVAPGPSALFVGVGVDHYFGNIICRPERAEAPQTAQFDDAVAVSLAFLKAALAGEPLAALARAPRPGQSWVETRP
ncbi:MAG: alpha/beta hydrolase family protein [Polymorphobacter sp.]